MFCPYCGAKNETGAKCFVCGQILPSLGAGAAERMASAPRPTRTNVPAEMPGGAGDRMLALLFDRLLLAGILLFPAAWLATSWERADLPSPLLSSILGGGMVALLIFLYHVILEATIGATLGKAILGLQMKNLSERNDWAAAAIRNVLRPIDALGGYLIGFLFVLFTRKNQRVGDLVARTVIVDFPVPRAARAALLFILIAAIATAVWLAGQQCPQCVPTR